jgi:hypothetical protein
MAYSFYHIFTTPYLFLLTLFFGLRGVGIHNVITKIYHICVITLISRKICDNLHYMIIRYILLFRELLLFPQNLVLDIFFIYIANNVELHIYIYVGATLMSAVTNEV